MALDDGFPPERSLPLARSLLCDTGLSPAALGRAHARRLREVYRSAGWPYQDALEIDLLAAGLLQRCTSAAGTDTVRLTDAGVAWLAGCQAGNRAVYSDHEALVAQVAQQMARDGRLVWCNLSLRAQVATGDAAKPLRWCMVRPDVFSIRNTSVEHYVDPVVHEIKVRRCDLLADLRRPDKRAGYLHLGECWYVLGCDARGRLIGEPNEVPAECGVLLWQQGRLQCARAAPRRSRQGLAFGLWMALAKATPLHWEEDAQTVLGPPDVEEQAAGGDYSVNAIGLAREATIERPHA